MKPPQQAKRVLNRRKVKGKKKIDIYNPIVFVSFLAFGILILGICILPGRLPHQYHNADRGMKLTKAPDGETASITTTSEVGRDEGEVSATEQPEIEEEVIVVDPDLLLTLERRVQIKNAMIHAWSGYKANAWGHDEVRPVSGGFNSHWGGLGTTLIDSLDTLWLMDMKDEFYEARDWVRDELNHDLDKNLSVFETTIRSLGGLLSAYAWSKDEVFLDKAKDIGERLFRAFPDGDQLGVPSEQVNLKNGRRSSQGWLAGKYIISEMGTLQVEFRDLASRTGKELYARKAEHVFEMLKDIQPADGLFPYFLSYKSGRLSFQNSDVSFGAFGDSFYEYQLKIWLQGGKKEPMYREMYDKSIDGMHQQLLHTTPDGLYYIGTRSSSTKFEHLTCFMGGLLALGAYTDPNGLDSTRAQRDLKTAKELARTCYQMYAQMPTGLAPDVVTFSGSLRGQGSSSFNVQKSDYGLRPETVETFFILNQLTGDPIYRTWGWEIFQAIEKYCKTPIAYGAYKNVRSTSGKPDDKMESFFLGETMKYLYLLFDPDTEVDILNKHVFNTEAHPLMILNEEDGHDNTDPNPIGETGTIDLSNETDEITASA